MTASDCHVYVYCIQLSVSRGFAEEKWRRTISVRGNGAWRLKEAAHGAQFHRFTDPVALWNLEKSTFILMELGALSQFHSQKREQKMLRAADPERNQEEPGFCARPLSLPIVRWLRVIICKRLR
jgi:hypothetical protein